VRLAYEIAYEAVQVEHAQLRDLDRDQRVETPTDRIIIPEPRAAWPGCMNIRQCLRCTTGRRRAEESQAGEKDCQNLGPDEKPGCFHGEVVCDFTSYYVGNSPAF
jgi:hypothetical protein